MVVKNSIFLLSYAIIAIVIVGVLGRKSIDKSFKRSSYYYRYYYGDNNAERYAKNDAVLIPSADYLDDTTLLRLKRQFEQVGNNVFQQQVSSEACLTSSGTLGTCRTVRQCYPHFRLAGLFRMDNWPLGSTQSTCSSFNSETGVQVYGVCCDNDPVFSLPLPFFPFPPSPADPFGELDQNNVNGFPSVANWPPPLPTHPPDHTIPPLPTHPPYPNLPDHLSTTISTSTTSTTTAKPANWPPPIPTHPPSTTLTTTHAAAATTTTTAIGTSTNGLEIEHSANNETGCGINGYEDQERIIGGQDSEIGEWPWMAAILNNGRLFCGGSLIDDVHILTAAHCVAHMNPWDVARLRVYLGDYNIKVKGEVQHVERKVRKAVRHRGFNPQTLYNDIALLTLDMPVKFTKFIHPVCLPRGKSLYTGKNATVIGWGSLREMGPTPAILQKVSIPIWGNNDCKMKYGYSAPGGIVEHFLCAGQTSRDSCSGDSGGPLMLGDGGKWTQIGIVSWGIGCGKGQFPGVYTRMTYFMSWINKNLKV